MASSSARARTPCDSGRSPVRIFSRLPRKWTPVWRRSSVSRRLDFPTSAPANKLHPGSMNVGPARFLFASQLRDSGIHLRSEREKIFGRYLVEPHGVLACRQGDAALGKF